MTECLEPVQTVKMTGLYKQAAAITQQHPMAAPSFHLVRYPINGRHAEWCYNEPSLEIIRERGKVSI
jgi:hypothetical protein